MSKPKGKPIIKIDKVFKEFGPLTVLKEVSFNIYPREFLFLIGPSGAGKTTLFRLLTHEITPTEGEIFFDDMEVSGKLSGKQLCELRRRVGRVFQDLKLIEDKTVEENIRLIFDILKTDREKVTEESERLLGLVGLSERSNLFPSQLAEGEKQRVGVARALVGQPDILLVDEPTSNLDPATSWQIIKLLRDINSKGTAVVIATHDEDIVSSLTARVIEIDEGKLVRDEKKGKYQADQ